MRELIWFLWGLILGSAATGIVFASATRLVITQYLA